MRYPFSDEWSAFVRADEAWEHELSRVFGETAFLARHDPRGEGEDGTELRRLFNERADALIRWRQSEGKHAYA